MLEINMENIERKKTQELAKQEKQRRNPFDGMQMYVEYIKYEKTENGASATLCGFDKTKLTSH